jgi:Inovirus Gp2
MSNKEINLIDPTVYYGPLIPAICDKILDIFEMARTTRARNFFLRFDLCFPDDQVRRDESWCFSEFIRRFSEDRTRSCGEIYYVAVPEQSISSRIHYHVFCLLDGHYTQCIYKHMEAVKRIWATVLHLPDARGLVNYRQPHEGNGVMLRKDVADYGDRLIFCLFQALYLAKERSKETLLMQRRRRFSSSAKIPSRRDEWPFPCSRMNVPITPRGRKQFEQEDPASVLSLSPLSPTLLNRPEGPFLGLQHPAGSIF